MANQGCEQINIEELRASAQCEGYGLGPSRPTHLRRPKSTLSGDSGRKGTCVNECPSMVTAMCGWLYTVAADPYYWDLTKSVVLFAIGVKVAKECIGLEFLTTCN
ncbi:uncharacterized protein LOC124168526 [Ischnura elegans]|uniref:uncharacterized protein LOC124168526 n=1 Tax=Ischnura elegans TaxID=197161 RepID=UPI001ED8799C|nr:uncharacterized protein LOC124168526 [Ischnura elegans]